MLGWMAWNEMYIQTGIQTDREIHAEKGTEIDKEMHIKIATVGGIDPGIERGRDRETNK